MTVLTRYIVREVLKGSLLALLILLTLFNLFTLSDELKDLGVGSYGLKEILWYVALTSPRVLYELVPSAALLGSLFVLGAMGNNKEIVAMRATGLSFFWIIKAVMLAGVVLFVLSVLVGEFIAPSTEREAQLLKINSQNKKTVLYSKHGLWLKEGAQFINIRGVHERGVLSDIYVYDLDDAGQLASMTHAEQADFKRDDLWAMQNIKQTHIVAQQTRSSQHQQMEWQTAIDPDLLNILAVKSDNLSLYDLFIYIDFLKENKQQAQAYELAFWSRLVNPLIIFVMLMISIPFVLGANRGVSTGGRILIGIIIGMAFNIFDKIAGNIGLAHGLNPLLMAILPSTILVFCGAAYALSRIR